MLYNYSLIERTLVYGPQFFSAVAAVLVLAYSGLPAGAAGFLRDKTYKLAAAAVFVLCVFIFLYAGSLFGAINNVEVRAMAVLLLAPAACFFILVVNPDPDRPGAFFLCLASLASMHAAFLGEQPLLILAAFLAMDLSLFAMIAAKKESRAYAAGLLVPKIVFIMACAAFAVLFAFSSGKTAQMAGAGTVLFMILFSTPGLLAMRPNDGEEGERFLQANTGPIVFSAIITALLAAGLLDAFPQAAAGRPVIIACTILACVNIYRTITEEKYSAFAGHDSINALFLLPALACGANVPGQTIGMLGLLFMLSAFLQNEFVLLHGQGRATVASVKYGFDRVKGGRLVFLGLLSGFAAEISVLVLFYRNIKQDPVLFTAVIFMALAFSVPLLNKLFMMMSMLKRSGLKSGGGHHVRATLFIVFVAAVIAKCLR